MYINMIINTLAYIPGSLQYRLPQRRDWTYRFISLLLHMKCVSKYLKTVYRGLGGEV